MSSESNDPLSPAGASAHVFVSIILLIGGCITEWLRNRFELSWISDLILILADLVIFVYLIGALGRAFRWSLNEWTGGKTTFQPLTRGSFFRQLIPTAVDWSEAAITLIHSFQIVFFVILGLFLIAIFFVHGNAPGPPPKHPGPDVPDKIPLYWQIFSTGYRLLASTTAWFIITGLSAILVLSTRFTQRWRSAEVQ